MVHRTQAQIAHKRRIQRVLVRISGHVDTHVVTSPFPVNAPAYLPLNEAWLIRAGDLSSLPVGQIGDPGNSMPVLRL